MFLLEPLQYDFMRNAYLAGTVIAVVSAVVGFFVVVRGLAFASHALAHIGFAGAAGAVFFGVDPLLGLLAFTTVSGLGMGLLGDRARGRDVATGIVLSFALGLGALFLSLYTRYATQAFSILFGTILGVSQADLQVSVVLGVLVLAAMAVIFRPLLFASIDPEVAAARGVPVRALSVGFLLLVAVTVAEAVQIVGVLLIFTLLIAPNAAASFVQKPWRAMGLAVILALVQVWVGITAAYYTRAPVSFYIATIGFALYLAGRFAAPRVFAPRRSVRSGSAALERPPEPA